MYPELTAEEVDYVTGKVLEWDQRVGERASVAKPAAPAV
jgi:hypothetical protein